MYVCGYGPQKYVYLNLFDREQFQQVSVYLSGYEFSAPFLDPLLLYSTLRPGS